MSAATQMGAMAPSLTSKIRFAWLLPAAELLLSAALLWPVRLVVFQGLGIPLPHMLQQTMLPDYFRWASKRDFFLTSVAALNIPALAVQLPYVITSDTKNEWMPAGMEPRIWRAVTLPWLCLPFWWMAGRAIDALTVIKQGRIGPRIRWVEAVLGLLWVAGGVTLLVGFMVSLPADKDADFTQFAASGGLWALLGALSVIARFRQWRLQKLQKPAATAATA